jgi:hypothetical protein
MINRVRCQVTEGRMVGLVEGGGGCACLGPIPTTPASERWC